LKGPDSRQTRPEGASIPLSAPAMAMTMPPPITAFWVAPLEGEAAALLAVVRADVVPEAPAEAEDPPLVILNSSDIYATSQPFSIKQQGALYPTATTATSPLEQTGTAAVGASTSGGSSASAGASGTTGRGHPVA
jgi:hypothetical protein